MQLWHHKSAIPWNLFHPLRGMYVLDFCSFTFVIMWHGGLWRDFVAYVWHWRQWEKSTKTKSFDFEGSAFFVFVKVLILLLRRKKLFWNDRVESLFFFFSFFLTAIQTYREKLLSDGWRSWWWRWWWSFGGVSNHFGECRVSVITPQRCDGGCSRDPTQSF